MGIVSKIHQIEAETVCFASGIQMGLKLVDHPKVMKVKELVM
jgi:hypothetical protein